MSRSLPLSKDAFPVLATSSIEEVERASAVLVVDEPEETLQSWLNLSAVLLSCAKQIRQRVEQVAIKWISVNGPVQVGELRYTVGHNKAVKCVDASACMIQLLEACQGDVGGITEYLRSDPWKYGSVRSLLGDAAFDQLFVTDVKAKLVEGSATPVLITTNPRFAKPRKSAPASAEDNS